MEIIHTSNNALEISDVMHTIPPKHQSRNSSKEFMGSISTPPQKHEVNTSTTATYVKNLIISPNGRNIVINFTLADDNSKSRDEVIVEYSLDAGQTWKIPKGLFGDFGKNVTVGENKRIVWSVLDDFPAGIERDADLRVETLSEKQLSNGK